MGATEGAAESTRTCMIHIRQSTQGLPQQWHASFQKAFELMKLGVAGVNMMT